MTSKRAKIKAKIKARIKARTTPDPNHTHRCVYCDATGNPAPGGMVHSYDVPVGGYLGGTCRACLVDSRCAVCYRHPTESGHPCSQVQGVAMCRPCAKEAQAISRMMMPVG